MVKQKKRSSLNPIIEQDSTFLLKLILYILLGMSWIKLSHGSSIRLPIPIGFLIGLLFTLHEHFSIDRKIEYAILVVGLLIGFIAPFGLYINL